jgi:hypothetical protein
MMTDAPGAALFGATLEIDAVLTVIPILFDHEPPCLT